MNIKHFIDGVLQRLTNREAKNISKIKSTPRHRTPIGTTAQVDGVCGACGGEIVETNVITHRRACFDCGREAK